jgi:hypothetical protein
MEVRQGGKLLSGQVSFRLVNTTEAPLRRVPLWLYPNLFETPAQGLESRLVPWIYPAGHSAGSMDVSAAWWNGTALTSPAIRYQPMSLPGRGEVSRALGFVDLAQPLAPGEAGTLRLQFTVKVPTRRGRFGHFRGVTVLSDGFYPRPISSLDARDLSQPFSPIEITAVVTVPQGLAAVLHDHIDTQSSSIRTSTVGPVTTDILSLVLLENAQVSVLKPQGVEVTCVRRRPHRREPGGRDWARSQGGMVSSLAPVDPCERLGSVAARIDALRGRPDRLGALLVVEVPMWDELVALSGAQLVVSDRLYRIIQAEPAQRFHDLAVARGIGSFMALRSQRSTDRDRYVWAEASGALVSESYSEQVHGKERSVQQLVGFASFIPLIDNLLYAPQVPFSEAYFRSVERRDPLRDEPWRFMNERPDGSRLLGKLADLVGQTQARAAVEAIAAGKEAQATLESVVPGGAAWFLSQWMGRYPSVDYALVETRDEATPDGRYVHTAVIERRGEVIREPVAVLFTDKEEAQGIAIWPGQGTRGEVSWSSTAELKRAELDPASRLVEDTALSGGHPLANNSTKLRWRPPLLTRLLATFDAVSGDPYVTVSFALRRKFDITNSYHLDLDYTPRGYGAGFTYLRYFGKARTLNARQLYAGPTLAILRSRALADTASVPDGVSKEAATTGMIGFLLGSDNREYFWDPRRGLGWSLIGRYQVGQRDDGKAVHVGRGGAHLVGLIPMAVGHTLALHGGLMGLVGNPVGADLSTLSVRNVLRAFDPEETYGRLGMYAGLEYRHVLFDASRVSAPLFLWVDRFQGVLFAEGGTISEPDGYDGLFSQRRLFADVGYGLRAHLLLFGVQQYMVAVDFAVPVAPSERFYEIEQSDGTISKAPRAPFKIVIGITQTF